ncbi:MAG: hypothetical protein NT009_08645 [Proteobacteria bacterium]|nr:hypothetical protein [Pseudomonadota bacterium]
MQKFGLVVIGLVVGLIIYALASNILKPKIQIFATGPSEHSESSSWIIENERYIRWCVAQLGTPGGIACVEKADLQAPGAIRSLFK